MIVTVASIKFHLSSSLCLQDCVFLLVLHGLTGASRLQKSRFQKNPQQRAQKRHFGLFLVQRLARSTQSALSAQRASPYQYYSALSAFRCITAVARKARGSTD